MEQKRTCVSTSIKINCPASSKIVQLFPSNFTNTTFGRYLVCGFV